MKKLITALATAGLLAGVFGFAAPRTAEASGVIWVSMKGTPVIDVNDLAYSNHDTSMGYGPYRVNYTRAGYDCLHPDYNDIQLAVDNSVDNDTIYICPGLWKMQVGWQAAYNSRGPVAIFTDNPISNDATTGLRFVGAGMNKTIIDGRRGGNVLPYAFDIYSESGAELLDATFASLTVQGFSAVAVIGDDLTCVNAAFQRNGSRDGYSGGGALGAYGTVDSSGCLFADNHSTTGGAINADVWIDHGSKLVGNTADGDGGGAYAYVYAELHGTVFTNNRAIAGDGGAVYTDADATVSFEHIVASKNRAAVDGGAIFVEDSGTDPDVFVTSSVFIGNTAGANGGAVRVANDQYVYVTGSTFRNNRATHLGGGIASYYIDYSGNMFIGNVAGGCGGAVYNYYGGGAIRTPEANTYRGNRDADGVSTWCID